MFAPDFFLPKDAGQTLFVITHELLHRLFDRRAVLNGGDDPTDEYVEGYYVALRSEIAFLENIIDCIERS